MKKVFLIFLLSLYGFAFSKPNHDIKIYNFKDFNEKVISGNSGDTLLVINFWATWCGPCVKELPFFEEVNKTYQSKRVKVILVSLDFEKQFQDKLLPFVTEKNLKSELVWLNDTKYNEWIDKVSPEWSGAIPATGFIKNGKVLKFIEKELYLDELEQTINKLL